MNKNKLIKETTITYNNLENCAVCITHDRKLINRLNKLIDNGNEEITVDFDENTRERSYSFPKTWIKVRPPKTISEEHRKFLSEHATGLCKLRNDRKGSKNE